jgi:hypothetical protein
MTTLRVCCCHKTAAGDGVNGGEKGRWGDEGRVKSVREEENTK